MITIATRGRRAGKPWRLWALATGVFLLVTLPNLGLWPEVLQDEVQIIDLGRVVLDPDTDWSMGWLLHESMATRSTSFLGVGLQEFAYRLLQPADFGSRLSSLFGAVLASALTLGWLLSRRTPAGIALLLSLAFLLDPIFNESYRQGRLDSWCFAVCIAACWLLRQVSADPKDTGRNRVRLTAAGALCGLSVFIWPSALALAPLVVVEFSHALEATWKTGHDGRGRRLLHHGGLFAAGGLVIAAVGAIPILVQWDAIATSFSYNARVQEMAASIKFSLVGMYVLYDPWIIPAFVIGALLGREYRLLLALALSLAMMYQTMLYPMRILYLLPYLVAIIGGAFTALAAIAYAPRRKLVAGVALSLLVAGNSWTTAVKRPLMGHLQADARSPERVFEALEASIGEGPYRVLTTEWDVYYAARDLGWKTYLLFGGARNSSPEFAGFLDNMDYVLFRDEFTFVKGIDAEDLARNGFVEVLDIAFPRLEAPSEIERALFGTDAEGIVYRDLLVFSKAPDALP